MGLCACADLVWGVIVVAYDDDGNATKFWDEEDDDWWELGDDSPLDIRQFGHYNMDEPVAILTTKGVKAISVYGYDPKVVTPADLDVPDKAVSKAQDAARDAGLDVSFYTRAAWYLVASYG